MNLENICILHNRFTYLLLCILSLHFIISFQSLKVTIFETITRKAAVKKIKL